MSKESIKASINTYIKENGNLAITGQILNSVMNEMVDGLASEEELAIKQDALTLTIKDNGNIGNDSLVSLGLPANTLDIVGKLTTMEEHLQHLRAGMNGFLPNISLLLRHAAGQLFEEANYIAKFNPQLSLFTNYDIKYAYDPQKLGAFYTPTYLARSIVEKVIKESHIEDKEEISILDPACGSGEFLVEALRQLKTIGFTGKVKVYGWDVSSVAINIANFVLHFEKEEWNNSLELHIEEHRKPYR